MHMPVLRRGATALLVLTLAPCQAWAASDLIDGWTDLLISTSGIVIVFASLLGIVYAAQSLLRAYRASDEERMRHLFAAVFAGMFTMIGVLVGWISFLVAGA